MAIGRTILEYLRAVGRGLHRDEGYQLTAINGENDQLLAELWDNEKDAEYDHI